MKLHPNKLLDPWVIFGLWVVLWLGRWLLIPAYFQRKLDLNYYAPEGDTIEIAIVGNEVMTVVVAPVFAIVLWFLLRRSESSRRSCLAWDRGRWVLSLIFSIPFVFFALLALTGLREDLHLQLYLNSLADIGWFFFWLALRAVAVSRIPSDSGVSRTTGSVPGSARSLV